LLIARTASFHAKHLPGQTVIDFCAMVRPLYLSDLPFQLYWNHVLPPLPWQLTAQKQTGIAEPALVTLSPVQYEW
jgi:hypothetical protein